MERTLYSVSDLVSKTRTLLELSFKNVWVEGEVSNVHYHSSGHLYFTTKDSQAELRCVMFKSSNSFMRFQIEDGMRVACLGSLSMFEQRGQVQFIIKKIEISGIGTLHQAFESLKNRLDKEGLFSIEHKIKIKKIPKKIGIVTSGEGAALKDMIHVIRRRSPYLDVIFRPAKVQGEGAAQDIANGIIELAAIKGMDTIIIGRGGGSIEDLWAFNEEILARTVFNCDVPIISAVGHETDFTISDFVSDVRAATPTEAAEIISLSVEEISSVIKKIEDRMINIVVGLNQSKMIALDEFINRLMILDPSNVIKSKKIALNHLYNFMVKHINEHAEVKKIKFLSLANQLRSIGPENVLKRGFSIAVNKETKKIIRSAKDIFSGADFMLKTGDGSFEAKKIN